MQIRGYARNKGFTYIGSAVPRSFPFNKTSVKWATSVRDVVAGDRGGKDLIFFDCVLVSGENQTVLAVRGTEDSFGPVHFGPSLSTERVEGWTMIYRPDQRLALEEVDALLAEI